MDKDAIIEELKARVVALENAMRVHQHRGNDTTRVDAEDIFGLFGIPRTGVPFGIQRSTDGTRFRLWLFPQDDVILAPENLRTTIYGTVLFTPLNITGLAPGQMGYHDNAGTQQFRGNAGGFFGSFDLTAV